METQQLSDIWDMMARSKGWKTDSMAAQKLSCHKSTYSRIHAGQTTNIERIEEALDGFIGVDPERPPVCPPDQFERLMMYYHLPERKKEEWRKKYSHKFREKMPEILIPSQEVIDQLDKIERQELLELKNRSINDQEVISGYLRYVLSLVREVIEDISQSHYMDAQNEKNK